MELGQNHGKVHVCKRAAEGVAFNLCSSKTARGLENSVRVLKHNFPSPAGTTLTPPESLLLRA
eukprot:scaffold94506_cov18-Tisochrysis_lutea.AAC.1